MHGSLVSTLVLPSETECPVALQWSPTPDGMVMSRLGQVVVLLEAFSKWAFGFTYVHVCRVLIACSSSSSQYCAGRRLTLHIRTLEVRPES